MNGKNPVPAPSLEGLWSLLWRAVVFTPLAMVFGVIWVVVWTGLYILPAVSILCFYLEEWGLGLVLLAVWPGLFLLTRWDRFRVHPKDELNGQENI